MIDGGGQGLGPGRARGPDLRPHIFDQLQARILPAQPLGHAQGEAPRVDQHRGVGLLSRGQRGGLIGALDHPWIGLQPFGPAEDRQVGDVERALQSLRRHPRAADADEAHALAQPPAQGPHKTSPQRIARGLGRDQHDAQRAAHSPNSGGRS